MLAVTLSMACGSDRIAGPTPYEPGDPAQGSPEAEAPPGTEPPSEAPPSNPPADTPPEAPAPPAPEPPPPPPPATAPAVLVGAGDIGLCGHDAAERTAALLDSIDGVVFTAGDHAYPHGSREDFANCYEPSWGRHKARTRPSPGNHDYETAAASPYFEYFGSNAGPAGRGYYSFTAGSWVVFSLNSNVPADAGSAQLNWLRHQLQLQPSRCTAAIWHHAIRSSGEHDDAPQMREVWRALHEFGADLVVSAHHHVYERFSPLDAEGRPGADGMRQFVVGTGGSDHDVPGPRRPGSEAFALTWGVLKLTLEPASYTWEFIPASGETYRDFGSATCR